MDLLLCPHVTEVGVRELSKVAFLRTLVPLMRALPPGSDPTQRPHILILSHSALGFQYGLGVHKHLDHNSRQCRSFWNLVALNEGSKNLCLRSLLRTCIIYLWFYLFIHERHTERGRDTGRGRSSPLQGARCRTWSQDPRITTWAKGRHSTTEPPGCPCIYVASMFLN